MHYQGRSWSQSPPFFCNSQIRALSQVRSTFTAHPPIYQPNLHPPLLFPKKKKNKKTKPKPRNPDLQQFRLHSQFCISLFPYCTYPGTASLLFLPSIFLLFDFSYSILLSIRRNTTLPPLHPFVSFPLLLFRRHSFRYPHNPFCVSHFVSYPSTFYPNISQLPSHVPQLIPLPTCASFYY